MASLYESFLRKSTIQFHLNGTFPRKSSTRFDLNDISCGNKAFNLILTAYFHGNMPPDFKKVQYIAKIKQKIIINCLILREYWYFFIFNDQIPFYSALKQNQTAHFHGNMPFDWKIFQIYMEILILIT